MSLSDRCVALLGYAAERFDVAWAIADWQLGNASVYFKGGTFYLCVPL